MSTQLKLNSIPSQFQLNLKLNVKSGISITIVNIVDHSDFIQFNFKAISNQCQLNSVSTQSHLKLNSSSSQAHLKLNSMSTQCQLKLNSSSTQHQLKLNSMSMSSQVFQYTPDITLSNS